MTIEEAIKQLQMIKLVHGKDTEVVVDCPNCSFRISIDKIIKK